MQIKKFDLGSGEQDKEDRKYWRSKTPEEKLEALEKIRRAGSKLRRKGEPDGNFEGLRRVFRIIEQK